MMPGRSMLIGFALLLVRENSGGDQGSGQELVTDRAFHVLAPEPPPRTPEQTAPASFRSHHPAPSQSSRRREVTISRTRDYGVTITVYAH